jgi:hypothetical protein
MKKFIILPIILVFILLGCTVNQPYVRYSPEEKARDSPENISDSLFVLKILGTNVDSVLVNAPRGTFVHLMSSTCRPCIKKLRHLDTLAQDENLHVLNIVMDDWSLNQNTRRIFTKFTRFKEAWILDHAEFSKDYSNRNRIIEFRKVLCPDCEFNTYYPVGYLDGSGFKLLQNPTELERYFREFIPTIDDHRKETLKNVLIPEIKE